MRELVKVLSGRSARKVMDFALGCIVLISLTTGSRITPIAVAGIIVFALILISICLDVKANGWKYQVDKPSVPSLVYACLWFAALLGIYFGSQEVGNIIAESATVVLVVGLLIAAILPRRTYC